MQHSMCVVVRLNSILNKYTVSNNEHDNVNSVMSYQHYLSIHAESKVIIIITVSIASA